MNTARHRVCRHAIWLFPVLLSAALMLALGRGHSGAADPPRLEKVVLLLPLNYNDGSPVPQPVLDEALNELFVRFGGYTTVGPVSGAYRMHDGSKQVDRSLEVWIAVASHQLDGVDAFAKHLGNELGQESVYLERTEAQVRLVDTRP